MFEIKNRRRKRLINQIFPERWDRLLEKRVYLYRTLREKERQKIQGDIQIFLDEKKFEGCGNLKITDEIRLVIASQASIMIAGGISDYFPSLKTILVYPDEYHAPVREFSEGGIVTEGHEWRQGEAWDRGSLVLSWKHAKEGAAVADGKNLVLHEFAHLLDSELGATENWRRKSWNDIYVQWSGILNREHKELIRKVERGESVLFDVYGAESLVEFFCCGYRMFF